MYGVAMTIFASDETPVLAPESAVEGAVASDAEFDLARIGARLLDDAYMAWLIAESEAEEAFQAWLDPATCTREVAYRAYLAAVDREAAAARDLQRLGEIAAPCVALLARQDTAEAVQRQSQEADPQPAE
jgi:hypothetical protein